MRAWCTWLVICVVKRNTIVPRRMSGSKWVQMLVELFAVFPGTVSGMCVCVGVFAKVRGQEKVSVLFKHSDCIHRDKRAR